MVATHIYEIFKSNITGIRFSIDLWSSKVIQVICIGNISEKCIISVLHIMSLNVLHVLFFPSAGAIFLVVLAVTSFNRFVHYCPANVFLSLNSILL